MDSNKWRQKVILLLLLGGIAAHPVRAQYGRNHTLSKGTPIEVRLTDRVSSKDNQSGDRFQAIVDENVTVEGEVVVPAGTLATGELISVEDSGRVQGRASMELSLRSLHSGPREYPISTNSIVVRANGTKGKDAKIIGGSAGVGAIIGAIAGGRKGAVLGAAIGAGAGTGAVLVTDGEAVEFEPEQKFRFFLTDDLSLPSLSWRTSMDIRSWRNQIGRSLDEFQDEIQNLVERLERELNRGSVESDAGLPVIRLYLSLSNIDQMARILRERTNEDSPEILNAGLGLMQGRIDEVDAVLRQSPLFGDDEDEVWQRARADAQRLERLTVVAPGMDEPAASGTFRWNGRVDGSVEITLQRGQVSTRILTGTYLQDTSFTLSSELPDYKPVEVVLHQIDGRDEVYLRETPSRWNDYRAVVYIDDSSRGSDEYTFELEWR